jgi:2-amino-4-hydroxy-6-hydroxymethyldihydropteridine diphosphokinase
MRIGNRVDNLHQAVNQLGRDVGRIVQTSFLYTTRPQYVCDQAPFLNAVVEIETKFSPQELLLVIRKFSLLLN